MLDTTHQNTDRTRGRVLRVKHGYNPNSSSIGSSITTFILLSAAAGGLTVLLTNLTDSVGALIRRRSRQRDGGDTRDSTGSS
jgi:hypothetical protein